MEWCILLFFSGWFIPSVVYADTDRYASPCSVPRCSHTQLAIGYDGLDCYNFQTANNSFICSPLIRCSSVTKCSARNSCGSADEVCIVNSCCSKSICVSLALAERSCPTSGKQSTRTQATTRRTTTSSQISTRRTTTSSQISTRRTTTSSQMSTTPIADKCADMEVHVIGVYEASSGHSGSYHPTSDARVRLERAGEQVLVLSAYEPIRWHVEVAGNVILRAVHLIGFYKQTLASSHVNISITTDIGTDVACGYSWPYNGGGCDTNKILNLARNYGGGEITSFHGCYQASQWTIDANFRGTSNCATSSGYQQYSWYPMCSKTVSKWLRANFTTLGRSSCTQNRYMRYNEKYKLWVGVVLCNSASRYKLYLSDAPKGTFLEIADYAGHGQDHCELINPSFSIPNEDDITSGGCAQCAVGGLIDLQNVYVYARANFGQFFTRTLSTFWADLSTEWYQCGVNIP